MKTFEKSELNRKSVMIISVLKVDKNNVVVMEKVLLVQQIYLHDKLD